MLPYIILMFAPLLVYQVAILRNEQKGWHISIGKKPHILNNSLIVPVFFIIFFLILSLRHVSIGRDISSYRQYFYAFSSLDFVDIWKEDMDVLYVLLNWIVGRFTDDFQVFLAVVAVITVLPIAVFYSEDKQYGFLKVVLFMNMSTFVMIFSGLRQSIAISLGIIAFYFVRKKKPVHFLLTALIAFGFHHTAFMILLFYPLYHARMRRSNLLFIIPAVAAVFVFNRQIFGFLGSLAFRFFGDKYDVEIQETNAYLMLVLFALFVVVAYFFPDEKKMDKEDFALRNFLLMALMLQCFAPVHNLSMRMNYYFIIFIPVVIPKMLKLSKENFREIAWLAKWVMACFFMIYYLYNAYKGSQTGLSAMNIYPYRPFWEP